MSEKPRMNANGRQWAFEPMADRTLGPSLNSRRFAFIRGFTESKVGTAEVAEERREKNCDDLKIQILCVSPRSLHPLR